MKELRIAALVAVSAFSPPASSAQGYQFIISGDPVAAATAKSCSSSSAGRALETGTLGVLSSASNLDARTSTVCASPGRALRSDGWSGGFIVVFR
jgi:hypothetical protein